MEYPMPWSTDGTWSFLETIDTYKDLLKQAGFQVIESENVSWVFNPQLRAKKGLKEENDELERLEVK